MNFRLRRKSFVFLISYAKILILQRPLQITTNCLTLIELFYLHFVRALQFSFKYIDPKIAKNQFMKWKENIKTRDDCINYLKILIQEYMEYSKPLWEFHVVENYSDDTSAVIFRIHHSLSDGVGIVSMMSCVNDDKFSLRINKEFTQLNFFQRLVLTVWVF